MPGIILERLRQKYRTMRYPDGPAPELPDRWLGEPDVDAERCDGCGGCVGVCPTGAIAATPDKKGAKLDVGKCIFCGACRDACSRGAIAFSKRFAMARFARRDLVVPAPGAAEPSAPPERLRLIRSLFGKSLKLRQISAGGCNACEADSNVLGTVAWDMGRLGISFVASPRHADGILVTGPVTDNMRLAVAKTYAAVPEPKVVIAVGACAVSGGIYADGAEKGVLEDIAPVDLYIPGCPPHPLVILEGLLRLIGRVREELGT